MGIILASGAAVELIIFSAFARMTILLIIVLILSIGFRANIDIAAKGSRVIQLRLFCKKRNYLYCTFFGGHRDAQKLKKAFGES